MILSVFQKHCLARDCVLLFVIFLNKLCCVYFDICKEMVARNSITEFFVQLDFDIIQLHCFIICFLFVIFIVVTLFLTFQFMFNVLLEE